jgi:hypothetical protein
MRTECANNIEGASKHGERCEARGALIRAMLPVSVLPQMNHCREKEGGAWWPPRSSEMIVKAVIAFAEGRRRNDSLSRDGS